eukprot:GHVP01047465.1.p2 GENE.GHVP01047465.1~~GHVP01047465.1.p2  ORF type:complete len:201 (+),score=44.41 GHVP01047465.1:355-957(+)
MAANRPILVLILVVILIFVTVGGGFAIYFAVNGMDYSKGMAKDMAKIRYASYNEESSNVQEKETRAEKDSSSLYKVTNKYSKGEAKILELNKASRTFKISIGNVVNELKKNDKNLKKGITRNDVSDKWKNITSLKKVFSYSLKEVFKGLDIETISMIYNKWIDDLFEDKIIPNKDSFLDDIGDKLTKQGYSFTDKEKISE